MTYNEAETRFYLIDPVLREKGYNDHQWLKLETPAPAEATGAGPNGAGPGERDRARWLHTVAGSRGARGNYYRHRF